MWPHLLTSQPSLFGELQASGGLLLKINKEKKHRNLRFFLASMYLGCGSVVEWLPGTGKAMGSILHTI